MCFLYCTVYLNFFQSISPFDFQIISWIKNCQIIFTWFYCCFYSDLMVAWSIYNCLKCTGIPTVQVLTSVKLCHYFQYWIIIYNVCCPKKKYHNSFYTVIFWQNVAHFQSPILYINRVKVGCAFLLYRSTQNLKKIVICDSYIIWFL